MLVVMGNISALDRGEPLPGSRVTTFTIPEDYTRSEGLNSIYDPGEGAWIQHSDQPPTWVESDDPEIAKALAAHYGCPVGRPEGWGQADVVMREQD